MTVFNQSNAAASGRMPGNAVAAADLRRAEAGASPAIRRSAAA